MDDSETCLSPAVRQYFVPALPALHESEKSDLKETFIVDKVEIDFTKIVETINPDGDITEPWAARRIIPILRKLEEEFQSDSLEFDDVCCYVSWTSQSDHLRWCWDGLRAEIEDNMDSLESLLVLTSLLERSIGNIIISLHPTLKV